METDVRSVQERAQAVLVRAAELCQPDLEDSVDREHGAADLAVMQTHESLAALFASGRAVAGSAKYRVGPVAIPARRAEPMVSEPGRRTAAASIDPRQHGLFAAAWLVGYAAEAARAGVEAVTFGTLTGAVDDDGTPRPLFHVLKLLFAATNDIPEQSELEALLDEPLRLAIPVSAGQALGQRREVPDPGVVRLAWRGGGAKDVGVRPATRRRVVYGTGLM